jgi:5-methylcytosine-specific restriction enzyme subunit McrC
LNDQSPLSSSGGYDAPSLLFPMEAVFEAYVAKHLQKQLISPHVLKTQARGHHLVTHRDQGWFQLKPDLLIKELGQDRLVLDTKWKLLDATKSNGKDKYGLSQGDFYQLLAYGSNYLDGIGDLILIYPKTDDFLEPLPEFVFSKNSELRLWVLPFCLKDKQLKLPSSNELSMYFN